MTIINSRKTQLLSFFRRELFMASLSVFTIVSQTNFSLALRLTEATKVVKRLSHLDESRFGSLEIILLNILADEFILLETRNSNRSVGTSSFFRSG
uniref:Uncharacterized protein n=1 Tax=Lepeophtheirus salmonis TaxID=72036 RepID=A0A0K2V4N8_LEPSM